MNWRNLTDIALDDAFKERVVELFKVLSNDPSDENVNRFLRGLEGAKMAYDKLVTKLEM